MFRYYQRLFYPVGILPFNVGKVISVLLPGALEVTYRIDKRLMCGCKVGMKFEGGFCGCKREINSDLDYFHLSVNTNSLDFDEYYCNKVREILQRGEMMQRYPILG